MQSFMDHIYIYTADNCHNVLKSSIRDLTVSVLSISVCKVIIMAIVF